MIGIRVNPIKSQEKAQQFEKCADDTDAILLWTNKAVLLTMLSCKMDSLPSPAIDNPNKIK